jgi:hypothetical protein
MFAAALLALGVGMSGLASASTVLPVELRKGAYVNEDRDTRSITRMTFQYTTDDEPRCTDNGDGTTTCRHGVWREFRVRLWGSCSPEDCDWGTAVAERHPSGGDSVYVARYDQGFARRTVEIHPLGDSRLRLIVHSTYEDDRSDRTSASIMEMENVSWEPGTDRPGSDYRNFTLADDQPGLCARQCEAEYRCRAYTYVKPGIQGPEARCWLKHSVPGPRSGDCCVSGTK